MNITFMIGNGFDLNQNLKTSYKDFYKFYMTYTQENIISKSIKDNYKLWADLELGLGYLLRDIDESQIDDFFDCKASLEYLLIKYLTNESSRFAITDENKFTEEFTKKIVNFADEFCAEEKSKFKNLISQTREPIKYQFITFNYTNVLDKMIRTVKTKRDNLFEHIAQGMPVIDAVCTPHHIHGTLSGGDLILCVDNPSQINNESLRNNTKITNYMIKTNVNKELGEWKIELAKDIIDNSKYICLFGLSIGETDSTWWKYLAEWLTKSNNNRLVRFVRVDEKVQRSGSETIRSRDKNRAYFGDRSCSLDDKLYDSIKNRIIIVNNSKIFTYKNIAIKENEDGQA